MIEQDQCKKCSSKSNCETIYKKMGEYKGPSVLGKVFLAFVLPLFVFIVSLAVFDKLISESVMDNSLKTIFNFVIAFTVTFAVILAIRFLTRGFRKDRKHNLCKP